MAVGADAPAPTLAAPRRHVEDAVTQVGLGAGADARHRAAACRSLVLVRRHVRGMHQAPALVDRRVIEQPLHRALPAPGQTGHLFASVGTDGQTQWWIHFF